MKRLVAVILGFCLIISWAIFSPAYAAPPKTLFQLTQAGTLRITSTDTVNLQHIGQQLIITGPGLASTLDCRKLDCSTPDTVQIPATSVEQIELTLGRDKLTLDVSRTHQFDLAVAHSAENGAVNLKWSGDVRLTSADVAGQLTINHQGNKGDALTINGALAAENIDIVGGNIIINNAVTAIRNVNLLATDTLQIRDGEDQPVRIEAGGRLTLQANQIDIFALAHPDSALISGSDLVLRSQNTVRGDAHYLSGGQVRFEQLDGQPADLFSPYDPIILASGDVSLANYTGASLHILAGGSVTLNNVTITGADAAANTINPGNGTTFNGVDTLGSLANFNLSNGTAVSIDGSATPTLDVRAGINWATFTGGAPTDQVIPGGAVSPTFSGATGADITVTGVISMAQPSGVVLLTNQYRPNNLGGNISTGDIEANTTLPNTNGGSITIDSRNDIGVGALAAHTQVLGAGVTAGDGGDITLLAANGSISSGGDLTTHTIVPGNQSGTVGNGGDILVSAVGDITINNGNGLLTAYAFSNNLGSAGNGGTILVQSTAGDIRSGPLQAHTFAANGQAGDGGTITVNTANGGITINSTVFQESVQTFATSITGVTGDGGPVVISATQGITVAKGIFTRSNGNNSNGGDITLTTTTGSITAEDFEAIASHPSLAGNGGNVTLQALSGGIIAGDIDAYSHAFVIFGAASNGGQVTLEALAGNVQVGTIDTYASATGDTSSTGDGGDISLTAVGGQINSGALTAYAISTNNNGLSGTAGNGGSVLLQATQDIAVAGNIQTHSEAQTDGIAQNGGAIAITTTGLISTGNLSTYTKAMSHTLSGGDILLTAATGIVVNGGNGSVDASANSTDGNVGNGGNVTLNTTSGNLDLQSVNSSAKNTFGEGPAGNGGNINLTTGNGYIQITGSFFTAIDSAASTVDSGGPAGDVTLAATQGITLAARLQAFGFGTTVDGGDVILTTSGGDIATAEVLAYSQNNNNTVGNGGNITLQALNGGITSGEISAYSHASTIHNPSGDGGNIIVTAGNGDVVSGQLDAHTEARGEFGHTGDAGQVTVTAPNGGIIINGDVRADAFSQDNNTNSGDVGNGQGITLQATDDITVNGGLTSFARSSRFDGLPTPTGNAGNAGPVILTANNISVSYIDARSIATGTIGSGGIVQIEANQFFQGAGAIFGSTETISAIGLSGTGAISITHGGAGVTPFVVGDASTNGVSGALATADASINPLNSYLASHFEPPNIWIVSVVPPPIITKSASPTIDAPYQGEIIYTVVISNEVLVDANGVFLTDTLPAEVDFNRWNQQNGATIVNDEITWNGTVPGGNAVTFEFVVDHIGNYSDVFTNTASFSHADTNGSGTASVAVAVEAPPVLSIIKTAAPNTDVTYQGEISYTIVLSNNSNTVANNTLLTDTLPTEVDFNRWTQQNGATVVNDEITWNGAVPANGSITFEFVVDHVGNYSDTFVNVANFSHPASGSSDMALAFVTIEPLQMADLLISKSSIRDEDAGVISYTVVVQNLGPHDADGVTVSDSIPAGINAFSWQCAPSGGATCTANGTGNINDTLTSFPVGGQVIYTVQATMVSTDVTVVNMATLLLPPGLTNTAPTNSAINTSGPVGNVFLPIVLSGAGGGGGGGPTAPPDLIVDSLIADSNTVTLTIKNIGSGPVVDAFWVDVYIDPDTPPTGVNQRWQDVGSQGLVWGVVAPALPIAANGGTLTLTLNDAYYSAKHSSFNPPLAVDTPVYAQVDSVNLLTNYGGVLEDHEVNGGAYNNINSTLSVFGSSEAALSTADDAPSIPAAILPQRE